MSRYLAFAVCDVAAGLLGLAGLIKFFDPVPWVAAVRALGVPLPRRGPWSTAARSVGVVEVALTIIVIGVGGETSYWMLALAYGAFALVSLVAWRRGGVSCGCFGVRSAPITRMHIGLDLVAVIAASGIAVGVAGPASLPDRLVDGVGASFAYVVFALLGVALLVVTMTTGAELVSLRRTVVTRSATVGVRR